MEKNIKYYIKVIEDNINNSQLKICYRNVTEKYCIYYNKHFIIKSRHLFYWTPTGFDLKISSVLVIFLD